MLEGVQQFQLENERGMRVTFLDFGGIITAIEVPDRNGRQGNVVLAYDTIAEYEADTAYLGALVGRYANRIASARFELDGTAYQLRANNGSNHLHGGPAGFSRGRWKVDPESSSRAMLELVSPDGDEGYPGTLQVRVSYSVSNDSSLDIEYEATTTRATHVNLTQHSYFNLSGARNGDILNHELTLNAGSFTPVDASLIPTGEISSVVGTPFDFTQSTSIGRFIDAPDDQLVIGDGYDHNFILEESGAVGHAATLRDPVSGRVMDVHTTEPGIQLYTGNKLASGLPTGMGNPHIRRGGVALETQHFPDSPNRAEFPPTVLRPGNTYRSITRYAFSVD